MTEAQLVERFSALAVLASQMHERCKQDHTSILDLLDLFTEHTNLYKAFQEDCDLYLKEGEEYGQELVDAVDGINRNLMCGVTHIRNTAFKMKTPIIEHLILQMNGMRPFPN